jgi:hypothetical protein
MSQPFAFPPNRPRNHARLLLVALIALGWPGAGRAAKLDPDGLDPAQVRAVLAPTQPDGGLGTTEVPDIFGPGAVLRAGNLYMKVTNMGHVGNYFLSTSGDPAGQWPGGSGIEYLSTIRLAVGAKDPTAPDLSSSRRVSYFLEWRPPTLAPVDHIYESYEGAPRGLRHFNEDGDRNSLLEHVVDEEFLNGKDDDGNNGVDEDYATWGQQMFSWEMRDDTPEAQNATLNEKHIPLGLECRQLAWAYSTPGNTDFNVIEYRVRNVSGHRLDSLYVSLLVDLDAGPSADGSFFQDDFAVPNVPAGRYVFPIDPTDVRYQGPANQLRAGYMTPDVPPCSQFQRPNDLHPDSAFCPYEKINIHGFSLVDGDGDQGRTPGAVTFLMLGHTTDGTGQRGPRRVGFHSVRMAQSGLSYSGGGFPTVDQQRYELMASGEGVDPVTGLINLQPVAGTGDYAYVCSVGPFLDVAPGQTITLTCALTVTPATRAALAEPNGWLDVVHQAVTIQRAYNGVPQNRMIHGRRNSNYHGRETALRAPSGQSYFLTDCVDFWRSVNPWQEVTDDVDKFFNLDDDYCTGLWIPTVPNGYFQHRWLLPTPPVNPDLNVQAAFNYTANPQRNPAPGGDRKVVLTWDNKPEHTPDPQTEWFDFRGYRIWKASGWKRPIGSAGPGEADWTLIADYRLFDQRLRHCVRVYVPAKRDTQTICVNRGDLVDWEHGVVLTPDNTVRCVGFPACDTTRGRPNGSTTQFTRINHYPIGRYRYEDPKVLNGFGYFYSVTAYDSTGAGNNITMLHGRPVAVEADAVVPQASTATGRRVWVVPNPYRGSAQWDLSPSATDPTGTHVDFYGLPPGRWTIKIWTVAGDLVRELKWDEAVNESEREGGRPNLQQDHANDGQARWNLITRNGQDVASGIYLFTVESDEGLQRGKFVIIR